MKKLFIIGICLSVITTVLTGCKKMVTQSVNSDEELYSVLKEPLIGTIMYNGATLHPDGDVGQVFAYTFNGYMTNLPYKITLSRGTQFEDCAGCIGDWQTGMFSAPEHNGKFISLKEFIIQMVNSKDEKHGAGIMTWNTSGFIWKVVPTKEEGKYLVEINSSSDKVWRVRM